MTADEVSEKIAQTRMRHAFVSLLCTAALSACLPDYEVVKGSSGGSGGAGASGVGGGGVSGIGGAGTGATGGGLSDGGPGNCDDVAGWKDNPVLSVVLTNGKSPMIAYRPVQSDLALAWIDEDKVFFAYPKLDGTGALPQPVSTVAGAKDLRIAWNQTSSKLAMVWYDTTLTLAIANTQGAPAVAPVYSINNADPDGKSPRSATIAPRDNGGFALIWMGFDNGAERLHGLVVDSSGARQTNVSGEEFTRLTDNPPYVCHNKQAALIAVPGGFALTWASWTTCTDQADIHFGLLGPDLMPPIGSETTLNPQPDVSEHPAIASAYQGNYGIAWLDNRTSAVMRVHFTRVENGMESAAWPLPSGAPSPNLAPSVAASPGEYLIAWQSSNGVYVASANAAGPRTPVLVSASANLDDTPSAVWAGSQWAVAWISQPADGGPATQIHISTCTP